MIMHQPFISAVFYLLTTLLLASLVSTHGSGQGRRDQAPLLAPDEKDWATIHMAEEHHIANLDPSAFFTLHDYNGDGFWTKEEVRQTYGYDDETARGISEEKKQEGANKVLEVFDDNRDEHISRDEFIRGWIDHGKRLPDLGTGPGHHGDDEYEYEIHHFEKYHDENTTEADLTHPEDIAHFRKHDEMDAEAERQEQLDSMTIVEANIPAKFRRTQ